MRGIGAPRGFTLIELLVVVLIIAILAAVALPQYLVAIRTAEVRSYLPILKALETEQERYYLEHGQYATRFAELDVKLPENFNEDYVYDTGERYSNNKVRIYTDTIKSGVEFSKYATKGWPPSFEIRHQKYYGTRIRIDTPNHMNRCQVHTEDTIGNKVCLSLGGTLEYNTGLWNIYSF